MPVIVEAISPYTLSCTRLCSNYVWLNNDAHVQADTSHHSCPPTQFSYCVLLAAITLGLLLQPISTYSLLFYGSSQAPCRIRKLVTPQPFLWIMDGKVQYFLCLHTEKKMIQLHKWWYKIIQSVFSCTTGCMLQENVVRVHTHAMEVACV